MTVTSTKKDRSGIVKANKERYKLKVETRLAKRKAWRLKKYGSAPVTELTRNTLQLFMKWNHRKDECKSAIRTKRFKAPPKRKTGFSGHWG